MGVGLAQVEVLVDGIVLQGGLASGSDMAVAEETYAFLAQDATRISGGAALLNAFRHGGRDT